MISECTINYPEWKVVRRTFSINYPEWKVVRIIKLNTLLAFLITIGVWRIKLDILLAFLITIGVWIVNYGCRGVEWTIFGNTPSMFHLQSTTNRL
jgi:hypothetical protein